MDYKSMELRSPLYGLVVRNPIGDEAIAVLGNLSEAYELDNLRPVLNEMKIKGVRNIVLDLSQFPATSRGRWLAYLDGAIAIGYDFEVRYIGITTGEAFNDPRYREYITPKIAEKLDAAVESLVK